MRFQPSRGPSLRRALAGLLGLAAAGCAAVPGTPAEDDLGAVEAALDGWHAAASRADAKGYFGRMTDDAIFLGTDATERWTKAEFEAYAAPYFGRGQGWTYVPRERHVYFGAGRDVAWFDERLWNDKYGESRGTGALRREAGGWRLAHYSLTFPIPNDLAADFTKQIRAHSEPEDGEPAGERTLE